MLGSHFVSGADVGCCVGVADWESVDIQNCSVYRSSDLTCLDFFLWWHMKQLVYETVVETDEDLIARITVAAGTRNLRTDTTIWSDDVLRA